MPAGDASKMVEIMHRNGTKLTLFCGHGALFAPHTRLGREYDLQVARTYAPLMRAYYPMTSRTLDYGADIARFEKHYGLYVGMKFLADYYSVPLTDKINAPFFRYADAHKLPVLCHTWGGSAYDGEDNVRAVADMYPNVRLILGHCLHDNWHEAARIAREHENVYLELTAVADDRGAIEILAGEAGSEKIVFGTDLPWFGTEHGIGAVLCCASLNDEDRRNIFYRNAKRMLAHCGWLHEMQIGGI